ncbi:hypothetical protein J2W42_000944 [Rhizobium tibeticum]|uniref:hypothetical protein n=1 Tax=Rhizobium tibeticum TaxID=501024 RepID=UPI00278888CE|nr:hypothetical protein [Rhizobium tibeticum]MDP9808106.1 hypothetical protein [Rhizobium tibeticum]
MNVVSETIRNPNGDVLFFSLADFVGTICEGSNCFVCGRSQSVTEFNNEHILPNWLLHKYSLHDRKLTLPNGVEQKYGTYKVPCCKDCNSEMSVVFETPMSRLLSSGPDAVQDFIVTQGSLIPYTWMALIFLKAHLKDRLLRRHLDRRKGDEMIAADYAWPDMHHLHAVARAFKVNASVSMKAMGSLYVFPIEHGGTRDDFDMQTFTDAQTLYLRLGHVSIIAVFNDAHAANNRVEWLLEKIDGPVSWMQARELAVHFAMANIDLINRPVFRTVIFDRKTITLEGHTDPVPQFEPFKIEAFGEAMRNTFPHLPQIDGHTSEETARLLRSGEMSFLTDASGNFIRHHALNRRISGLS